MNKHDVLTVVNVIIVFSICIVVGLSIVTKETATINKCAVETSTFRDYCYCLGGPNVHFNNDSCRIGDFMFYEKDYSK